MWIVLLCSVQLLLMFIILIRQSHVVLRARIVLGLRSRRIYHSVSFLSRHHTILSRLHFIVYVFLSEALRIRRRRGLRRLQQLCLLCQRAPFRDLALVHRVVVGVDQSQRDHAAQRDEDRPQVIV